LTRRPEGGHTERDPIPPQLRILIWSMLGVVAVLALVDLAK
jgi:hypothetical protein